MCHALIKAATKRDEKRDLWWQCMDWNQRDTLFYDGDMFLP